MRHQVMARLRDVIESNSEEEKEKDNDKSPTYPPKKFGRGHLKGPFFKHPSKRRK